MADAPESENTNAGSQQPNEADMVRQVAERVWELWQEELRQERERRSEFRR